MLVPPIPADEKERLKTLYELNILDTPLEESFERITRLTKELFKVPMVAITLIDEKRYWLKSAQGLSGREGAREESFCAHAMLQKEGLNIPNALNDQRFADNPFVIGEPHIRFYAGYPIEAVNGKKLGTVCIVDNCPRQFSDKELASLKDIARLIEEEIKKRSLSIAQKKLLAEFDQAKRNSLLDDLTGLWNRAGIDLILNYQINAGLEQGKVFGIGIMDVDHFKLFNDEYGHNVGDKVLQEIGTQLIKNCREEDAIGRWGGEEFIFVCNTSSREFLMTVAERFRTAIAKLEIESAEKKLKVTATFGLAEFIPEMKLTKEQLINEADRALYRGKHLGRNRIDVAW